MSIPIPKTVAIQASPSHTTVVIWIRVSWDSHITRVFGWRCPKSGDAHITVTPDANKNAMKVLKGMQWDIDIYSLSVKVILVILLAVISFFASNDQKLSVST